MSEKNPEIEKILETLAQLCCESLQGQSSGGLQRERVGPLLKTLLMSGFSRNHGPPLQVQLEQRIQATCGEHAMHRGAERSALTGHLQSQYDTLVRWESREPELRTPPKSANISSATDA